MNILFPELEEFDSSLKYLVIDSKYGTHPWRFSVETFLKFSRNQINVYYLSLVTMDPSVFFGRTKKFFRRIIYQNERHNYARSFIDKDRIISTKFLLPKANNVFNCFKVFFNKFPNDSLKIAIESWLSTKYGSTRYRKTLLSRFLSMRVARSYFKTVELLKYIYSKDNFDVLVTFNGRFPIDSAILQFCKDNGIQSILFDGGSIAHDNFNRIQYFKTSPHNEKEISEKINRYWKIGGEDKVDIANKAMTSLINSERFVGNSFYWEDTEQTDSLGDFYFNDLDLENTVTFFASSDWEQGAINAWSSKIGFLSQFDMLISLAKVCNDNNLKLLIKPHPIRKNVKRNSNLNEFISWEKFCKNNDITARVISKFDNLSTKRLLTKSAVIAGYGTSVLAQSLYVGRPTIVGRQEPWINDSNIKSLVENEKQIQLILTEVTHQNFSHNENLLTRKSVLPWAYYRTVCGIDMLETNFSREKLLIGAAQLDKRKRLYSRFYVTMTETRTDIK